MQKIETPKALLAGLIAGAVSFGCVTQSKFDQVENDRDILQTANALLVEQMDTLRAENTGLSDELASTRLEVNALTGTYDSLVGELREEVEAGQIEIQRVSEGISLNVSEELLFGSGEVELNETGRALLARVADRIQSEPSSVWVEGHTDNVPVGKALKQHYPTNWELAGARAANVVKVLTESGVDPTRLRAVSRGPFDPVAPNDTDEGRAKNRRTEIILRPAG